ncbi:hypothetical protein [Mesoflavibacter zeaxanthinifaciens]|uniref:hypothetical protein n=1 Tax=Mesoflavibacter zeaxanthinifaciens TaxID=393060 RepID=UPI0026EFBD72|nr:hypothetical protein [Mesoflavibacter zeaxanthinifaciens]
MKVDLKNVETEDLINELCRRPDMVTIYPLNTAYIAQVMDIEENILLEYSNELNGYFNSDEVEDYFIDKINEFKLCHLN